MDPLVTKIVLGVTSAVAGGSLISLFLRRDTASEARRETLQELAVICESYGLTFIGKILNKLVIRDLSGAIATAIASLQMLKEPEERNAHFQKIFKTLLSLPENEQLVLNKATEIKLLQAAKNVQTPQVAKVDDITITNSTTSTTSTTPESSIE